MIAYKAVAAELDPVHYQNNANQVANRVKGKIARYVILSQGIQLLT
jgi:hypothetical protein